MLSVFFALLGSAHIKAVDEIDLPLWWLILPTFYTQLLHMQIPNEQKYTVNPSVFFALLGSGLVKALSKMLVKLTLHRSPMESRHTNPSMKRPKLGRKGETV
jgi:hypothetical protein